MHQKLSIMVIGSLILLAACQENPIGLFQHEGKPYFGEYEVLSIHGSFYEVYDTNGGILDYEEREEEIFDPLLRISKGKKDSLIIEGLINDRDSDHPRRTVLAVVAQDSLEIVYEKSSAFANDLIRGRIWFRADSIFMDYGWNRQDHAFSSFSPEVGWVRARGKRIE